MDATTATMEAGILRDTSDLATWTRQRSSEELQQFVNRRDALLPDAIEVE